MIRRDVDRYELERRFAPDLDPNWTEAVLLELRLLGVRGDRIGAALSEADAFCVDSGQGAAEAFGDPVAYARSLDLPAEPDPTPREHLGALGRVGLDVLTVLLLAAAYPAWRRGEALTVTVGTAAVAAAILLGVGVLLWQGDRMLRVLVRGSVRARVTFGLVLAAWFSLAITLPLLLHGPIWVVPAGAVLVVAVLALVAGAVLHRHAPPPDDPVSAPLTGSPPHTPRSTAAFAVVRWAPIAIGVVVIVGLTELTRVIG